MWDELQKVSSLMHVASPILKFTPQEHCSLPKQWALGIAYKLKLSFFGVIPLGNHAIELVEINEEERRIVTNEHGRLARVWNHTIRIEALDDQTIYYSDEIEIKAGLLTAPTWLFAHLFFRHRQRRWKKLLER
jgi:hypothetical protein